MQTHFISKQLSDPDIEQADTILRSCVHCGMCNAVCPTYLVTRDERNSPRGRIYLMKQYLETENPDRALVATTQRFIDYCLDCRACEVTCPSNVDYSQLAAISRKHLDASPQRSFGDHVFRRLIVALLSMYKVLRLILPLARRANFVFKWLPGKLGNLARAIPSAPPTFHPTAHTTSASPSPRKKIQRPPILLFHGCVAPAIRPSIASASQAVLEHLGFAVTTMSGQHCCGSLADHSGFSGKGHTQAQRLRQAIIDKPDQPSACVYTISGCGKKINQLSSLPASEFVQFVAKSNVAPEQKALAYWQKRRIAWHTPCSLKYALKAVAEIEAMWQKWNISVHQVEGDTLCCGSAGSYSLLEPEMSTELSRRSGDSIMKLNPDLVITHNIGCLEQIGPRLSCPIIMVEEWIAMLYGLLESTWQETSESAKGYNK